MNIDKPSFLGLFASKFWTKLTESLVPFTDKPLDKEAFLEQLHKDVTDFTYTPSHPRDYIVFNKYNGIPRYVPTFTRKDYCVYFLCVKLLENEIAFNRVEGTFGGWTLGNPIRLKEEQEKIEFDYIPFNTLNDLSWAEEWRSFQNIAKTYKDHDDYKYFTNIDIANFYDTINLSILERKIRHCVTKSKQDVVTLLFHFLHNWNKKLEGYSSKTIGIPQDEIGDCSRILANFYLQDYDLAMKEICDHYGAKFIRFADDQIIYSKSKEDATNILFEASKLLFKINLNINSGKVKEFKSKEEFEIYWAFEIFENLKDIENEEKINAGVEMYFDNIDKGIKFRNTSVLRRILKIDFEFIKPALRHRLLSGFFNPDFLSGLELWHFRKIRVKVNNDDEFFKMLDSLAETIIFNSFLYQLLNFYKKDRAGYDTTGIEKRITDLRG